MTADTTLDDNVTQAVNLQGRALGRAMRITIAYQDDELSVRARQLVSMRTPPSDLVVPERQSGFWFQVEDISGLAIYRKVMDNPVRFDTETPAGDPDRPLRRERLSVAQGTFFLVAPLTPEARSVRIFSSPFAPDRSAQPAREVLRFPLFADVPGSQPQEEQQP